jgi:hypothetical protein
MSPFYPELTLFVTLPAARTLGRAKLGLGPTTLGHAHICGRRDTRSTPRFLCVPEMKSNRLEQAGGERVLLARGASA